MQVSFWKELTRLVGVPEVQLLQNASFLIGGEAKEIIRFTTFVVVNSPSAGNSNLIGELSDFSSEDIIGPFHLVSDSISRWHQSFFLSSPFQKVDSRIEEIIVLQCFY